MKVEVEMSVERNHAATIDVDMHEVAEWLGRENVEPTPEQVREFLMAHRDYDDHLGNWYARSAPLPGSPWLNLNKVKLL